MDVRLLSNPKTRTATPAPGARRTRIPTPIRIQGKVMPPASSSSGRTTPSGRITPVPKGSGLPYRVETRDAVRAAGRASSLTQAGVKSRLPRAPTPMATTRPGEFRPGQRKGGRVLSNGRSFSMPMRSEEMIQTEIRKLDVPDKYHMHTPPPESDENDETMDSIDDSFVSATEEPTQEPRSFSMSVLEQESHGDSTTALLRDNPISRRHSLTVSLTETDSGTVLLKQQFKTVAIETVTGGETRDPVISNTQVTCSSDHVVVSTGTSHMTYPTCLYTWTLVDQKLTNPYLARHKLKYALVAIPIPVSGLPNLSRQVSRVSLESRMSVISVDDSARRSSFGRLKSLLRKKDKEVVTKPYVPSSRDKPEYSLVLLFDSKHTQQTWKEKLGYLLEGDSGQQVTRHRPHTPPQDEDLGFKVDRDKLRSYMDVGGWSKLVRKRDSVVESEKSEKRDSRSSGSLRKSKSFRNFRDSFYSKSESTEPRDEARDESRDETTYEPSQDDEPTQHCIDHTQHGHTPIIPVEEVVVMDTVTPDLDTPTTNMFEQSVYPTHAPHELPPNVELSRDATLRRRPQGIAMAREASEGTVREANSRDTHSPEHSRDVSSRSSVSHDPLSHDRLSRDLQPHDFNPHTDDWNRFSLYTLNTTNSSCPITPVTPELNTNHMSPVIAFSANTTPPINMLHTVPSHASTVKNPVYGEHLNYGDHVTPLKTPLWLPGHSKAKSDIRSALTRDRGGGSMPVTPVTSTADLLTLTRDRPHHDVVSLKSREFQLKSTSGRPQLHKTVSNPCLVDATDEADKMNKISSEAARLWLKRRQSVATITLAPPVSLQQLVKEPAVRKMTKNVYNGQLPGWHALSQASSRVPAVPVPQR